MSPPLTPNPIRWTGSWRPAKVTISSTGSGIIPGRTHLSPRLSLRVEFEVHPEEDGDEKSEERGREERVDPPGHEGVE